MNNFIRKGLFIFSFLFLAVSAWAQEPTNYPVGFAAATQSGTSVQLTWTGSIGANLPSNYLILVRVVPGGTITAPTDAAAVADDNDLSDNLGAINVVHAVGANSYTWTGLPIDTDFEFVIYPYKTGGATDPDFKVPPPAAPAVTASTKRPTVTTPTVTGADQTTATLGGTVTSNGGNALSERGTVWKVGSGVTIADNKVAEGGTGVSTFTQARTGITAGSQIFYAAYATNVAGTSLSPESSFFTFSIVPDNHPTVNATTTGFATADITFTALSANGGNVNGYIILRRAGADPLTSSVQDGVAPGSLALGASTLVATITTASQTVYNDTGLNPDTDYHYAVVPFNWNTANPETYNYKVGAGFNIDNAVTFSASSRIVLGAATNPTIAYRTRQAGTIDNTDLSKSVRIANYIIDDGGAADDADSQPTTLTSITISISNSSMVRRVALFSDNAPTPGDPQEIAGTEQDAAPTVTFAVNLPTPGDNTTFNFMVRATFQATVTDNTPIQIAITSVTAAPNGSGFAAIGTWPSTTTAPTENVIIVDANKYIFVPATPPSVGIGANFGPLTVQAVDGLNNRDLDFSGQEVELTRSGGTGTLTSGQPLNPTLTAGQFTWTTLSITGSGGTYTLNATDDNDGDALGGDAISGSFLISSGSVNINQPAPLDLCAGGNYKGFPAADANIVITETDNSSFSAPGGTLQLALPSGFNFDQTVTTAPIVSGADISAPSVLSYPAANVVQFSYTISGTTAINSITIAGLKVQYTGPPGAPVSGSITRFGGTATIAGDNIGTVHAAVNFVPKTPPPGLGFTVTALPGDVTIVNPNETNFSSTGNAVQLNGTPGPPGVSFSGASVTSVAGSYRFNPSTLAPGPYPITFTYTEQTPEACQFTFTKVFNVYSSGINNLATVYCTNDAVTSDFTVTQSTIDQFAPGFAVDRYVYYNFNTFAWINITTPSNTIFDPALPAYQPIYNQSPAYGYPTAIFIGYYVCDPLALAGTTYACDGDSPRFGRYQMVEMRPAPTVTFTVAQPPLGFCDDNAPVTLVGSPANSNNVTFDNFTANSGQGASISHAIVAAKEVWTLSPASVSGVTAAASQTFNVTYKYTDPVTGCDNTATKPIKVNDRPPIVPASVISPATPHQIALCQGTAVGSFTATDPVALPNYTFKWYSDNPTTNLLNTGPTFSPPVDNLTPGTTPFFVTQEANGCESITPLSLSVVVNATPAPPTIANTTLEYCINEPIPDLVATGSSIKWYTGSGVFIRADPSPSAVELGIDNTTAGFYSFYVTQTANGCEGYIPGTATYVTVTIKSLPNVSITADKNINAICTTKGSLTFTAVDLNDGGAAATNGTWSGAGLAGALNPTPLLGTTDLNPVALLPGGYNLTYTYQNPATNCSNASTVALTILPTITPNIVVGNVCDGFPAIIVNNSTVNQAGGSTSTIDFAEWTLGDGGTVSPAGPSGSPIPANTNGGRTTGTFLEPNHIYPNVGTFQISGILTTSDGCSYAIPQQPVTVSPNPVINFAWLSVCRDGTSTTQFHGAETSNPVIPITNYAWNFNLNNTLTVATAGTGQNPTVNYSSDGTDMVRLIATTAANCKDTIQKPVYIVPSYPPVNENNAYSQNFESGTDGWIAGGTNSSWELGHPNGPTIQDDADLPLNTGNAWDTNLTGISNTNEQSWVLSRCFDFTQAAKPIIAFDIWSDTPTLNDGAVLQYNISGNIENDAHWFVIGNVNQGANWYDATGISSGPGNQAAIPGSNDVGWTGSYPGWRKAAFKLDNLIGQPKVVFRIAFASNLPRRDGFAFDNVFIGERTRTVLFENFTNSSAAANSRSHNEIYNSFSNSSTEIAKIQFHTQFPGDDPLNEDNAPIHNSRTAFYGITNTGMFTVDGIVVAGPVALAKQYDDRVLTPSPIRITINQVKDGEIVRINTTLRNITSEPISLDNINVFTTIVEKRIKDPAFLGENQDTVFRFVARKMLPNASGISLSGDLAPNQDLNVPEVVWEDAGLLNNNQGAIVVFVQNTEGDNKEVVQAKVVNATVVPDLTTNVFPEFAESIRIFPNPANNSLTVQLPEALNQTIPVNFTDSYGREVISLSIDKGSRERVISTEQLATGLYFINIKSTGGQLVRRKVMIVHKN